MPYETVDPPLVLDRREGPHGEVVLRRHGDLLQIIANGCFLMDTSDGRSERLLVRAALTELAAGRDPADEARDPAADGRDRDRAPSLLIGGLGVGFSLAEAAAEPRWGAITVVEREAAIIDWHGVDGPLSGVTSEALRDPRTRVLHTDLVAYLQHGTTEHRGAADPADPVGVASGGNFHHIGTSSPPSERPTAPAPLPDAAFDAICLDIDNGPDWTVTEDNTSLYSPSGLAACRDRLTPGGVLAVWSAQPSPTFEDALRHAGFQRVHTEEIRVVRGVPDVVHFATKPA